MALAASCPSCGAPVVFKSAASIFAVCEYCQSTLVRHDQALEDIGKMAALAEDRSPLQLGTEGRYQGVHFALIGRIQLKYSQGLWNEWYLLFDDLRTGWLSEASGEYVLTFVQPVQEPLPPLDDLKVGQRFALASQPWTVSNIEQAECIAGQGELPFWVGAGYPVATVDLRNGANFATLDYSETPPLLFTGEAVEFKALQLSNLRTAMAVPEKTVEVRVFRCPSCGAPMSARSREILAVGCVSCGAVVNTADKNYQLLSKAQGNRAEQYMLRLPLGSQGRLEEKSVEVIGCLVRQTKSEGVTYCWREYLLAAENGSYRWLTEYNGHWNVVDVLSDVPKKSGAIEIGEVRYGGEVYRHYSTTQSATVVQVSGEFNWRVKLGDAVRVIDYVAPPLLLSVERSPQEQTWSRGRYLAAVDLAAAFNLKKPLPEPLGVFANQPNPWAETHRHACRLFWKLAGLLLLVQLLFVALGGGKLLLRQELLFSPLIAESTLQTREFEVRGRSNKLTVHNNTSLDNNWLGLELALINKTTGMAWPVTRELAYYWGHEGGENWSEGRRNDEVVFLDIPAGTYYLTVDPDLAPEKPVQISDTLEVWRGGAGWSNFFLALVFLAIFPIFSRLRHAAFEARRWAESDHAPPVNGDSDSDD